MNIPDWISSTEAVDASEFYSPTHGFYLMQPYDCQSQVCCKFARIKKICAFMCSNQWTLFQVDKNTHWTFTFVEIIIWLPIRALTFWYISSGAMSPVKNAFSRRQKKSGFYTFDILRQRAVDPGLRKPGHGRCCCSPPFGKVVSVRRICLKCPNVFVSNCNGQKYLSQMPKCICLKLQWPKVFVSNYKTHFETGSSWPGAEETWSWPLLLLSSIWKGCVSTKHLFDVWCSFRPIELGRKKARWQKAAKT